MTLTTTELVNTYRARTGLPARQVLLLLARCALVRHLTDTYGDRFILKGGALLYHVYHAQRVSFVDTDFADIKTHVADPGEIEAAMTIRSPDGDYSLTTIPDGRDALGV